MATTEFSKPFFVESNTNNQDVTTLTHQNLKELGNKMFADARYTEAIQFYTYAINKQPNSSSYFSNRALCYIQMQEFSKALSDCRQAIEIDRNNLKAHFFAGEAYLALGQYEEALTKLVYAHNLALKQGRNFGDDITSAIRLAKRKQFEATDELRRQEEIALQTYLHDLIMQDCHKQKQAIISTSTTDSGSSNLTIKASVQADNIENTSAESLSNPPIIKDNPILMTESMSPELKSQLSQIDSLTAKRISEVNDLFSQVDERRQKREVPDYLCGRISFELLRDPVITPCGITYERKSLITHLRQVGHFDPLSRKPLTEDQLIPNLALKEVVSAYLEKNPWAETF